MLKIVDITTQSGQVTSSKLSSANAKLVHVCGFLCVLSSEEVCDQCMLLECFLLVISVNYYII